MELEFQVERSPNQQHFTQLIQLYSVLVMQAAVEFYEEAEKERYEFFKSRLRSFLHQHHNKPLGNRRLQETAEEFLQKNQDKAMETTKLLQTNLNSQHFALREKVLNRLWTKKSMRV